MKKFIKIASLLLTLIAVAVLVPVIWLLSLDPNQYKPQLEQQALSQGIALEINGELNWKLFPQLTLIAKDLNVEQPQVSGHLTAELEQISLALDLAPLLKQQIVVNAIEVSGANLHFDAGKKQTAEPVEGDVGDNPASTESSAENREENSSANLAQSTQINDLNIERARITYLNEEGQSNELNLASLSAQNIRLDGQPYTLAVDMSLDDTGSPCGPCLRLSGEFSAQTDLTLNRYTLDSTNLTLQAKQEQTRIQALLPIQANVDMADNSWSLNTTAADIEGAKLTLDASGALAPFNADGQLSIGQLGRLIKTLLPSADPSLSNSLKQLALSFQHTSEQIKISNGLLVTDDTVSSPISFDLTQPLSERGALDASINISTFDLGRLIALTTPSNSHDGVVSKEANKSASNPLSGLDQAPQTRVKLNIGQLNYDQHQIEQFKVTLTTKPGQATLQIIDALYASGSASAFIEANSTGQPAINIQALDLKGLDLTALSPDSNLLGKANLNFKGQINNLDQPDMLASLNGQGQANVSQLAFTGMNVERQICESAQTLGASPAALETWPEGTQLDDLTSPFTIDAGQLLLSPMTTAMGTLKMAGQAQLDLSKLDYRATVNLRFEGEKTSEQGCTVNRLLRNVDVPLTCSGSMSPEADQSQNSCGLDRSLVGNLIRQQARGAIGRGLAKLLGDDDTDNQSADSSQNGQNVQPSDQQQQEPKEQLKDAARNILEGFFNR